MGITLKSLEQFKTYCFEELLEAEIFTDDDTKSWKNEFRDAKKKKIDGLICDRKFFLAYISQLPNIANCVGVRLVLFLTDAGATEEVCEERRVVQDRAELKKNETVHLSSIIC